MECPEAAASLPQFVLGMVMNDSLCPEELTYVCIRVLVGYGHLYTPPPPF